MISVRMLSIIQVFLGSAFMLASIIVSTKMNKGVPFDLRGKWRAMTFLMFFFLAGYVLFLVIQIVGLEFPLELVTGSIFLGGSFFVFLVINLSQNTISRIIKAEKGREEIQAQLHQAQKLESVGRLAGGVAHDFNNILSVILGYCELSLLRMPADDPLKETMETIDAASMKAAALVRQLLVFSRQQVLEMKVVNLNAIVENMSKMLLRLIGEDVALETKMPRSVRNIKADPGQLEQILMNLVVNSRDAMPFGGQLFVETADVVLDEGYVQHHAGLEPGSYVMLAVTDTGEGMSREVREQIFDPFFTTKGQGKGTGLGLTTVHGIVKQHHGHIHVYSEEGQGTTFKVYFPATVEAVEEAVAEEEVAAVAPGLELILVVDDEPSIRSLIMDTLQPLGYHCLEAACGEDALNVAQEAEQNIALLLTDVIMTGMSGRELADIFAVKYPKTRVVFMSGYTDNLIASHGVLEPQTDFLAKPLTISCLTNKIRQVMRRP